MKLTARGETIKVAFPTDIHAPYHNPYAVDMACKIIEDYDPDILVNGGDALDMYAISRFSKNPDRVKRGLQNEIDTFQQIQRKLNDAASNRNTNVLLSGNHEKRYQKFIWDNPELYGLRAMNLDRVLELEDLDLKMVEDLIIGRVEFRHGDFATMYSAKKHLENNGYQRSIFIGHTHKLGMWVKTTASDVVMAVECGGLFDITKAEYIQGRAQWQNALVLVDIVRGKPVPHIIPFYGSNRYMWAYWDDKEYRP